MWRVAVDGKGWLMDFGRMGWDGMRWWVDEETLRRLELTELIWSSHSWGAVASYILDFMASMLLGLV